ncbi:alpha/beta hydrolase [Roseovarius aestuarii]|nr:alpha/beta hydrolase [Roseovarius aestuarii]
MNDAPFYADVADAPEDTHAYWVQADDGLRLRVSHSPVAEARGSVLIFPGRTEYVEKYGFAAQALAARGFASMTIDWRGQGLSDRLLADPMPGHVAQFSDYQRDVRAMVAAAKALDLTRPWHLLAHSMGGCIGLRALFNGLDVASTSFTGPMWGIRISEFLRPVAWSLSWSSRWLGLGHKHPPGAQAECYVRTEPFETNKLTNDADMYRAMTEQVTRYPALALGGPSMLWLNEALRECRDLSRLPSPDVPCLTIAGTDEDIVDLGRLTNRMSRWPGGHLEWVPGGQHEVLMDTPATRTRIFDMLAAFYADPDSIRAIPSAPTARQAG